jgi:hypothetical protein
LPCDDLTGHSKSRLHGCSMERRPPSAGVF